MGFILFTLKCWCGWRAHNYRYRDQVIPCVVGTMPTKKLKTNLLILIRSYFKGPYGTAG